MVQAAADDTVTEDTATEQEGTEQQEQTGEESQVEASGEESEGEGAEDEVVVSIGGDSPPPEEEESRAPEWVRELRKSNREKDRRIRELEAKVASAAPAQPAAVVVGEKPTLEGCDYDAVKFERELEGWHQRKKDADDQKARNDAEAKKQQDAWQAKVDAYEKAKAKLKVSNFAEAEDVVKDTLSQLQQSVLLSGADTPELLVVALGSNPKKCKELAAISDPVKFAFALAKLETQLKVTPKKSAPPPERTVRSAVAGAAAVDDQLARLRAEADKTGDRSKVVAYMRQQRRAST